MNAPTISPTFAQESLNLIAKRIKTLELCHKMYERKGLEIPRCFFSDGSPKWVESLYVKIWKEFTQTESESYDDTFRWEMNHVIGLIQENGIETVLGWTPQYMADAGYTELYTYPLHIWAMERDFLVTEHLNEFIRNASRYFMKPEIANMDTVFMLVQAKHFLRLVVMLARHLGKKTLPR